MKRFGEDFELTQELLNNIAVYMNDDIREKNTSCVCSMYARRFFKSIRQRRSRF